MTDVTMRIWRGDANGGELKDYTIEPNEGEVVLDIIHRLQATQTPISPVVGTARPENAARARPRSTVDLASCA